MYEAHGSRRVPGTAGPTPNLYTIADDLLIVEVVKVGHRSDVYR